MFVYTRWKHMCNNSFTYSILIKDYQSSFSIKNIIYLYTIHYYLSIYFNNNKNQQTLYEKNKENVSDLTTIITY